ncbi:YbaY family lipoprotein [Rhodococcus sp. NPDC059234]|uniref:YbaY family lipoprotein n=1 Tax=Rhodococcus sp. NPDC059234 TaxID=3346781 RepID=UPI0036730C38
MRTRRILELVLGVGALIAVVAAVGMSLGSSGVSEANGRDVRDELTVTGDVAYRERIAWPEGAVVTVRLEDVSRADAPSVVLAEQRITDATGVPVPFQLTADRGVIDPRARLNVSARIEVDGALRWITDTAHTVPVDGSVPAAHLLVVGVPNP